MAISTITGAGIATDTLTAADIAADAVGASEIAADAVGLSELAAATGVTADYHKVPAFADDAARNTAIPSPTVGMIIYNTEASALQQYNGTWSTIAPAPNVTSVSGFLNEDTDSTITIFGSNFTTASSVKMFDASAGGTQIGSNATTTFVSNAILKAVFGGSGVPVAGNTVYIEIDNAGATNRFATAITVNADPTVVHAGATGTSANTTTHLGTYGGAGAGGPDESNTKLLLNFDRGGGTDIEDSANTGGNGNKVIANNQAVIKASPFGDGKSAILFDGTNDKLSIPDHADFHFDTDDFTIECWMWTNAADYKAIFNQSNNNDADMLQIDLQTNGNPQFRLKTGNVVRMQIDATGGPLVDHTWNHLAAVKEGHIYTLYLNGRSVGTPVTYTSAIPNFTDAFLIGCRQSSSTFYDFHNGYMDEFRIVKGVAVYTGNFTVPTARFSGSGQSAGASGSNISAVTAAQTKLLIHSNLSNGGAGYATFADSATTGTIHVPAVTGCFHSTLYNVAENTVTLPAMAWPASGKTFGSTGAYFDGTTDWLAVGIKNTVPANLGFGTGDDFTFDFWMNTSSAQSNSTGRFFGTVDGLSWGNESGKGWWFGYYYASSVGYIYTNNGTASEDTNKRVSVGNLHDSAWHHIALVRAAADNDAMLVYVDGNYKGTMAVATELGVNYFACAIGSDDPTAGGSAYLGYLDSFRVSRSLITTTTVTSDWGNFDQPTTIYGAALSKTIPTITLTGAATQLAADEDIEFTAVENSGKADGSRSFIDTDVGLVLTNLTGGDKNKATLTGTMTSDGGTTHTNMPLKLQVRKTLGNAAYANASRTVTFSSSTTTIGLSPAMPVSGTGIPADTTITSVDTTTTITLSANPTGGTLTGQSLVFLDLTRISHQYNGSDTLNNADAMYTIATGAGGDPVLFNARRYIGEGAPRYISGYGFQIDMIWSKKRGGTEHGNIVDSVRGSTLRMYPNLTNAEASGGPTSFNADGFTTSAGYGGDAENNAAFIAWGWKAGGTPSGAGKTMTDGTETTISSSATFNASADMYDTDHFASNGVKRSVNTAGGFSITEITNPSSAIANRGIPHGLGSIPDFVIIKPSSVTGGWVAMHSGLTSNATLNNKYINIAQAAQGSRPGGQTAATNYHVFTDNASGWEQNVANSRIIVYSWKTMAGVSAFGNYIGTSGGNKVTLDFRPKFILTKAYTDTSSYTSWTMVDASRSTGWGTSGTATISASNVPPLYLDLNKQEGQRAGATSASTADVTIYDDGFKFTAANDETNANGGWGYIYAAFA